MTLKLQVIRGDRAGEQFALAGDRQLTFGRDLACDVQICDQGMSRQHFVVGADQGVCLLRDLQSSNGTYLNGQLVDSSRLGAGDVITAGETEFRVLTDEPPQRKRQESTTVRVREEDGAAPRFREKRRIDPSGSSLEGTAPEALKALYQLGNLIHRERDLERLCQVLLDEILGILAAAERGCIVLLEGDQLVPIAFRSRQGEGDFSLSRTILRESIEHGHATISADAMTDERYSAEDSVNLQGIRAVMCVPLPGRERVKGAIYLDSRAREDQFREAELELLTAIGLQAGLALERTQLEQEIRRSAQAYRDLIEYSPDGIIQTTPAGKIVSCNQAAVEIFKTTRAELLSWNARQLYYNPEDRERILEIYRHHGALTDHEVAFRNARGEKIIVAISSRHVRDEQTGEEHFEAILRDITHRAKLEEALVKSEERHRTIVENAPLILCRADLAGRVTDINPFGRRVLELQLPPGGPGPSIHKLFGELDQELQTLLVRGEPFEKSGYRWRGRGGAQRYFNISGVPLVDAREALSGALLLALDVTREKELSEEVLRQERMASIGLLAAGVAHEFNNIIASMQGYAQLVGRKPEFTVEKLQEVVLLQSDRAKQITESLMSFSRRRGDARGLTDMRALLDQVLVLVKKELEQNRIELITQHEDLPLLKINAAGIQQVILNLLMNAVHAMHGGGTLTISTRRQGNYVYVAFRDTGEGIAREDLRRIFQPFFTTKGAIGKSQTPGTGLGLSVSYNLVQDHRGEILVESERGAGSTFTIMLPIHSSAPEEKPQRRPPTDRAPTPDGTLRILVVEDDPAQREALAEMLSSHQVRAAGNGQQALALCRREQFDYCLLDVLLAGSLNGMQTFDEIRRLDPRVRIVFVSARPQDDLLRPYLERAHGFLAKPFGEEELLAMLVPVE